VEEWVDDAAASLEKLVGSPMAGAVHDVVLDRKYWPAIGTVLPARIAPSGAMDINWDVLAG
jgi:hypothetical protein